MAENTSEDLVRLLVTQSRSFPETTAHHDNRDRKENPVARQFSLAQPKYDALRKTYNNAGSLWIDCTIGSAMTAELNRVGDPNPSSRCYCRILCCRGIIIILQDPAGTEPECPKKVPRNHVNVKLHIFTCFALTLQPPG